MIPDSAKSILPAERLIVALDVPNAADARALVLRLGEAARVYKIGLELFMAGDYFELLDWLVSQQKKVFVDLKFFDVPETVRAAVRALDREEKVLGDLLRTRVEEALDDKRPSVAAADVFKRLRAHHARRGKASDK